MQIAHNLYPNWNESTPLETYQPIIHYLGKVKHLHSSPDLQGVAFVAYQGSDHTIGLLWFRYGCCVGCDRLADCKSYAEVDSLIEQMAEAIEWMPVGQVEVWAMGLPLLGEERTLMREFVASTNLL